MLTTVHRQRRRRISDDHPFYPIHPGEIWQEVVRVALEDRLDIRLIALEEEGAGANDTLGFLQVTELLHHFARDDPGPYRVGQHVNQPDKGLVQEELHRITVYYLDLVHSLEYIT